MYPGIPKAFTMTSMIGKINKTLSFANQVIPLYVKAKPLLANAKDAMKVAKIFMEQPSKKNIIQPKEVNEVKKISKQIPKVNNNPVFFL